VVRGLARLSAHANQVRRLLALAVIYDGGGRHVAAQVGGVGLQTVQDWVLRFNASGPDGLLNHCCLAWNRLTDQPWRIMSAINEAVERVRDQSILDYEYDPATARLKAVSK